MEKVGTFGIQIGRFWLISAILWLFEIQKIWDFQYFWANLATFFFQNAILSKIGPRTIKNEDCLGTKDGLYQFLIEF